MQAEEQKATLDLLDKEYRKQVADTIEKLLGPGCGNTAKGKAGRKGRLFGLAGGNNGRI